MMTAPTKKVLQVLKIVFLSSLALGMIAWLLNRFGLLPFHISESKFHLILLPLFELSFIAALFPLSYKELRAGPTRKFFLWVFIFAVVNLVIVSLLRHYYTHPERVTYPQTRLWLSLSLGIIPILSAMVAISGWFAFQKAISIVMQSLQLDPQDGVWTAKWPGIIFLAACLGLGLFLRLYKLDGFPPYVDEYIHTHRAFAMVSGKPLGGARGFLTVDLPVFLSYTSLGVSLWSSRFPMVIINMLAIFPLFKFMRKINHLVGYLSVFLFVTNPWVIAASRTVREYAVAPLWFFLVALFLSQLLEWEGHSKRSYLKMHWWRILFLLFFLAYLVFDWYSVLKISVAFYGSFGVVAILKILKKRPGIKIRITLLSVSVVVMGLMVIASGLIQRTIETGSPFYKIALVFWNSLVKSPLNQPYWLSGLGYFFLCLSLLSALLLIKKPIANNYIFLFSFINFSLILLYMTFFLVNPHIPVRLRYGVLMEYWYLPLVAFCLWILFKLIRLLFKHKWPYWPLFVLLVLTFLVNWQGIQKGLKFNGGGSFEITGEKHYIVQPAYDYLKDNITPGDFILTDFVHRYDEIADRQLTGYETVGYYGYAYTDKQDPLNLISAYPKGWMLLSNNARPEKYGIPLESFTAGDVTATFQGQFGEIYIWDWGH